MQQCEVCGAEGTFKCSKCGSAYYCSAEHQRQAWKSHRPLCARLLAAAEAAAAAAAAEAGAEAGAEGARPARPPPPSALEERPPDGEADGGGRAAGLGGLRAPAPAPAPAPALEAPREFNRMGLHDGTCFFINLDRRQDRLKSMERVVTRQRWLTMSMRRIQAVDGKDLTWPQLVGDRLLAPEAEVEALRAEHQRRPTSGASFAERSTRVTLGACACTLSHRKAWQSLVDGDAGWALILEDDISAVSQRFDDELKAVLRMLPRVWHICYLGFYGGELLPDGSSFTGPFIHLNSNDGWVPGLYGYLISKAFAKTLLQRTLPMAAQLDAVVGCIAAGLERGYAVPVEQQLLQSPPPEESGDTDVQT